MAYEEQDEQQEQNAHVERINKVRDMYKDADLNTLCLALDTYRQRKDELEGMLKEVNAGYDVLRFELIPTKMDDEGVASPYNVKGLGRITLQSDLRVQVKDQPGLFGWLKRNKLGDLIKETVNASTLKASLKKRIIDGKPLPDGVEVTPLTRAQLTRLK